MDTNVPNVYQADDLFVFFFHQNVGQNYDIHKSSKLFENIPESRFFLLIVSYLKIYIANIYIYIQCYLSLCVAVKTALSRNT
jgi:hypothetical protein